MGVLDWLSDTGLFGGQSDQMGQAGAALSANMGATPPVPAAPSPPLAPSGTPSPSADLPGTNAPADPSTTDIGGSIPPGGTGAPPSVPMPQPRPSGAPPAAAPPPQAAPPAPAPSPQPPGPPLNLAPPAPIAPQTGAPPQGFLSQALGVTNPGQLSQSIQQGAGGLAAGLKSVGTNWNKPGLAAFSGSMGSGIEGAQKQADVQKKQAADYLKAAVDAKKSGDETAYKQNYLQYLAAKLKADTDKAASSDAKNKNDTPTQLYLAAQRLVQNDPEVVDARKALESARKTGEPADVTAASNRLQQIVQQKQAEHLAGVGLHPQDAATIAKQPGNAQENPINGKTAGLTPENIGKKLQPGQWFTNPTDGKLLQYKGVPKQKKDEAVKGVPSKPTNPEPANPMNKSDISAGKTTGTKDSDDDDED